MQSFHPEAHPVTGVAAVRRIAAGLLRRLNLICGGILCVLVVLWIWPAPAPDPSKVDPSLRRLIPPFTTFWIDYYLDGGSIGIRVVDSQGRTEAFALPVDRTHYWNSYPRLFVGATHTSLPGAVEVPFNTDTRRMLILWIDANRSPANMNDGVLLTLRGSPRDYARFSARVANNLIR